MEKVDNVSSDKCESASVTFKSFALLFAVMSFAFPGFIVVAIFFAGVSAVGRMASHSVERENYGLDGREVDYSVDDCESATAQNPKEQLGELANAN
jgi:hypothetical protein